MPGGPAVEGHSTTSDDELRWHQDYEAESMNAAMGEHYIGLTTLKN